MSLSVQKEEKGVDFITNKWIFEKHRIDNRMIFVPEYNLMMNPDIIFTNKKSIIPYKINVVKMVDFFLKKMVKLRIKGVNESDNCKPNSGRNWCNS